MTPQTRAFIAPEPFAPRMIVVEIRPGQTIAGILLEAVRREEIALEDLGRVSVYVDGTDLEDELGREGMLDYVPPAGAILNVRVNVFGGGGGGGDKNPLQTVLQIALIVASFWVGGPAGPLATAAVWVRTAAAVAINVAGQAALGAAFSRGGDGLKDASDRRALEGASNQFRLREPFPLQLGRERVAADMAASPYTQNVGDDTFLHLAVAWHYGETLLEDVKIGETLLSDYPAADISVEHFLTPGVPRESYLFPGSVRQENFSDQLDFTGGGVWEVHTAAAGAERIEVDITLPNGLKFNSPNSGKTRNEQVSVRIEFAEVGSEAWALGGEYTLDMRTNDAIRRTTGFNVPDATAQYKVRAKAWDPQFEYPEEEGKTWSTYWTALRAINRTRPVLDDTLAVSFFRIRSSDDLNGQLPMISGIVTPIVPVWNGEDWSETAPTSNEAALARWLVTGPAAAKPLREDQIDPSVVDAFELIEANQWGAAVQIRDDASQQDALLRLGRAGRFSTYWTGRALAFVTEWEKPAPRQVFTGRNAEAYRYRRTFPEPIHAVIVEFRDPETTSVAGETIVYADGFDATNAELFETLSLDFSCTIERAFKEGRAYLAKRALLVESHEWTAGVDAIATTYGDRVLVRHWSNLYGEADGRVDYRHWQGGLIAGVRLDEPVTMEAGVDYAIDVRRADGVLRGIPIVNAPGETRSIMFAVPLEVDEAPEKGDVVVFGRVNLITEDVEIVDIEPSGEFSASIRAVRYIGEELVAAETGPIPPLVTGVSPRPTAPTPRIIGATGSPLGVTVAFEIDPVRGALLDSTAVRWRRSAEEGEPLNPWSSLPPLAAADRQLRTPPILDAVAAADDESGVYKVDVELRTVLRNGTISDPAVAAEILVSRLVLPPVGFEAAGYTRTGGDGSTYPVLAISADAIEAGDIQDLVVEIRKVGSAEWISAGQPLPSRNPVGDYTAVSGGFSYDVRGQWRTSDGWRSDFIQTDAPVAIPAGRISTDTQAVDGIGAALFASRLVDVESLAAANATAVDDILDGYPSILDAVEDAEIARDAAIVQAGLAGGSATAAAGSASAAGVSEGLAGGYATAASGSATAAATSSGNASTFAGQASTSASNANTSAINAGTSASAAAGSAATASTQASNASASAVSASSFAAIAASLGSGNTNPNSRFSNWPGTNPVNWTPWTPANGTVAKAAGRNGSPNAARLSNSGAGNFGLLADQTRATITGGEYVIIQVELTLVSGSLQGAGVYFDARSPSASVNYIVHNLAALPDVNGVVRGAGVAGETYRYGILRNAKGAAIDRYDMILLNRWSGFSPAGAAVIDWHVGGWRPATPEEIAAGVALPALSASVATTQEVVADLEDQFSLARYQVAAVTGGGAAVLTLVSDDYGTIAGLNADEIYFGENTFFDNATDTMRTTTGSNVRVVAYGAPFGTDGQLTEWEGPSSVAFASMSRANAYYYRANAVPYQGGLGTQTSSIRQNSSASVALSLGNNDILPVNFAYCVNGAAFVLNLNRNHTGSGGYLAGCVIRSCNPDGSDDIEIYAGGGGVFPGAPQGKAIDDIVVESTRSGPRRLYVRFSMGSGPITLSDVKFTVFHIG